MRLKSLFFFFFVVLGGVLRLSGQINDIHFRLVSPPGGFTLKSINDITEDHLGYIWMGTQQGLIRYDSKRTLWFIPSDTDSLSLPHEVVNCVLSDSKNTLWVGTSRGLCVFNRKTQNFSTIHYTYEDGEVASLNIRGMVEDRGRLFIVDNQSVGYLDEQANKLVRVGDDIIEAPSHIYKDYLNRIWIGTSEGEVFQLSDDRRNVKLMCDVGESTVNTIYADIRYLWIGYENHGAWKIDLKTGEKWQYSFPETPNKRHKNTRVRRITKDTYGRLWVGAYEGLFLDEGNGLERFNIEKNPGLPHTSIYEIYEDKQGCVWIGTWSGGVALYHHSDNFFRTFRHEQFRNSLTNNVISSFVQSSPDELFIGTEVGGLNLLNLQTETFNVVKLSQSEDVENIKVLKKDRLGGIWVGTFQRGLWLREAGKSEWQSFTSGPDDGFHLTADNVYAIHPVDSGVWIGTFGGEVAFFDFNTKKIFHPLRTSPESRRLNRLNVNCLWQDAQSRLWIGGQNLLVRVDLKSGEVVWYSEFTQPKVLSQVTIYSIWEKNPGELWLGTKNKGCLVYNSKSDSFTVFDANGLLKGKDVYGFVEDANKNIWLSSNNGLVLFNPEQNTSRHFVYADGLQSNLFNPKAVFRDNRGLLYFGGTNGFTRINPERIKKNKRPPFVMINDVRTHKGRHLFPLQIDHFQVEPVLLEPNENTFTISFAADNYLLPGKNRYRYRLRNYFDEWIETGEGSVLFSGIKAGNYRFEIIACNNDGVWNETPLIVPISIRQVWYLSRMALLFYFLCVGTILVFIFRFSRERLRLKQEVIREKNQRENEEKLHEMKLTFFTNISHEFRTPLTLINLPLQRLMCAKNLTESQREELEVVARNSGRLLQLINQLLDLRKLDKGKSELVLSSFDVVAFLRDLQRAFLAESKAKEINFDVQFETEEMSIDADREKLDVIVFNLLSNAFKYTPEKGRICLRLTRNEGKCMGTYDNQLSFGKLETSDFIEIAVEDTGRGIVGENLLRIFDRFEQGIKTVSGSGMKGTGIGLSLCKEYTLLHQGEIWARSTEGSGSCFSIRIPRKQKAQKMLYQSHTELSNLNRSKISRAEELNLVTKRDEKILLVEDNADFRTLLGKILEPYYELMFAKNGKEALMRLQNEGGDLVISDVMMPEMDGFEFCNAVKSKMETSHIPVILLTALSNHDNLITGLDKGADAYITKPFDEELLLKQVQNILEQRRRIRENFRFRFVEQQTTEAGGLDHFFLKRVAAVVENNLDNESFGIDVLAQELMISRSQLHRKIKSLTGASTTEFVNLVRLKKAVKLMSSGEYQFNEIAFRVGFSSPSYFHRCFKKVYGMTPGEYLASGKGEKHASKS